MQIAVNQFQAKSPLQSKKELIHFWFFKPNLVHSRVLSLVVSQKTVRQSCYHMFCGLSPFSFCCLSTMPGTFSHAVSTHTKRKGIVQASITCLGTCISQIESKVKDTTTHIMLIALSPNWKHLTLTSRPPICHRLVSSTTMKHLEKCKRPLINMMMMLLLSWYTFSS